MEEVSKLRSEFETAMEELLLSSKAPLELIKPMLYSLNGGGKRLRPLLLLATVSIIDHSLIEKAIQTAVALEYIHTYSLIHDDLPAMDDDQMRRGRATNHVEFDEATAILAGDAMLTDAFGIIARDNLLSFEQRVQLIGALSQASGSMGMVAGQISDIQSENKQIELETLQQIHHMKTGELFIFAVKSAGIISEVDQAILEELVKFGEHFGIAYQIHNDLKDVVLISPDHDALLKSDESNQKSTYPTLLGVEGSFQALEDEKTKAKACLEALCNKTSASFEKLDYFLNRLSTQKGEV